MHDRSIWGSTDAGPPAGFAPEDVAPPRPPDEGFPILSLAPDLSGTCNLSCQYCAEAASQPTRKAMSAEVLQRVWKFLAAVAPWDAPRSLRFGSGEPLLGMARLKELHELMSSSAEATTGPLPEVSVTTNGTLIDDDVADWLAATGWRIKVSIDGPRAIHDRYRLDRSGRPTYDRVETAVHRLLERCADRLSVAAVLCRDTDPAMVFEAIAALGIRRIELVPVVNADPNLWPSHADLDRYAAFVQQYAMSLAMDGVESHAVLVRFEECVRRVMGYDNQAFPCGAGRNFFGVSPEGGLYPCFRFVGIEEYRLGDLDTGVQPSRGAWFRAGPGRPYQDRSSCAACWAAPLCGGPCFSCAELFGGGRPIGYHCQYALADARAAVWLVGHLRGTDPERLLPFLPFSVELT